MARDGADTLDLREVFYNFLHSCAASTLAMEI